MKEETWRVKRAIAVNSKINNFKSNFRFTNSLEKMSLINIIKKMEMADVGWAKLIKLINKDKRKIFLFFQS